MGEAPVSDVERRRFEAGRHDWREADWQDHCGDPWCEICCGDIPYTERGPTPASKDSPHG